MSKSGSRRRHTAAFKAKVALAALQDGAEEVFAGGRARAEAENDGQIARLYEQIGRLKVENDFLSRRSGR